MGEEGVFHEIKNLFKILGKRINTDKSKIIGFPGTQYAQYNGDSQIMLIDCACYRTDPLVDRFIGWIRIVGKNDDIASKNALHICHTLWGNYKHGYEFTLKYCQKRKVNPNNTNNPVLGLYSEQFNGQTKQKKPEITQDKCQSDTAIN